MGQTDRDGYSSYNDDAIAMDSNFVAPEMLAREDVVERHIRLAQVVSHQIVPRLKSLHSTKPEIAAAISHEEVDQFAHLVLSPDIRTAEAFVTLLRERGLPMDFLFVELLEPAARHLGEMWNHDECDFVDVTLGLGRLQRLLATFNCTHQDPTLIERRSILMSTMPGDQHSFGAAMVEKFMRAGGWRVRSERVGSVGDLMEIVSGEWFALVGLAVGYDQHLGELADTIRRVRDKSCNRALGVIVGGPVFATHPERALEVGADATAANAPLAVMAAQKIFDQRAISALRAAAPGRSSRKG
ncbi:MAG: cobalamin B12-binding domain-containing protein [Beijerinckiaceae bacterium]|nr:cobalamin B12-binding domain-containing protein [Beijerinckiaceae bacterium]